MHHPDAPGHGVSVGRQLFASLAKAILWPAGVGGGGILLGKTAGPEAGVAGAIQTWFRDEKGRTVHRRPQEYRSVLLTYPVVGTFAIGSQADPGPTVSGGQIEMVVDTADGTISLLVSGTPVEIAVADDLPEMPVSVGHRGEPGLPGSSARGRLRLLAIGAAAGAAALTGAVAIGMGALYPKAVAVPEPADVAASTAETPAVAAGSAGSAPAADTGYLYGPPVVLPPKPLPVLTPPLQHVVRPGDTLTSISLRYYSSPEYVEAIRRANYLPSTGIYAGEVLTIPKVD